MQTLSRWLLPSRRESRAPLLPGKDRARFQAAGQPCQEPQARHEIVKVRRLDGRIGRLAREWPP